MKRTGPEEWSGQLSLFEDDSARQAPAGRDIVVFDLETQRSFRDVGGRTAMRDLGMSIGVVYSFRDDAFRRYHSRPEYLAMIDYKFGKETRRYVENMSKVQLRRRILEGL